MRKNYFLISVFLLLVIGFGCKKDQDPSLLYPVVKFTNIEIQNDGTVLVEGEVTDPGKFTDAYIKDVGFCYELVENDLQISDNQLSATLGSDNTFSATYSLIGFDHSKSYRLAAWATNQQTYGVSDELIIDSTFWDQGPLCDVAENTFTAIGSVGGTGTYSSVVDMGGDHYRANYGSDRFHIDFHDEIKEGLFVTHDNSSIENTVECWLQINGADYYLDDWITVFVEKVGTSSYRVTICDGRYWIDYFNYEYGTYTGSFIIP